LITALTKLGDNRDFWSFYYRARAERAWTLAHDPANRAAAIADLEDAIQGLSKLNQRFGDNPTDLFRISSAMQDSGRIKTLTGQREAAQKDLSSSAKILEGLLAQQPDRPMYQYELGRTYTALGQAAPDAAAAAEWYRKARKALESAVERYPENAEYRQALTELDAAAKRLP
jgi:hypothetical protein